MIDGTPVVLIASVSPYEGRLVERALKKTGWTVLRVEDAHDAAQQLDGGERKAVLIVDAGLLEMAHDPQWRVLRSHHADLRTVVRCLIPRAPQLQRTDGRTFQVHPDDVEGLCQAVRSLCEAGLPRA